MSAKDMAMCLLEAGTWKPPGKTPDATLGARIYMDIKKHGESSRFAKAGKELLNLMLEYQVGVRRKEVPLFEIKENLLDCNDEDDL